MRATKQDIKTIVFSGYALEFDGVSICNIENYLKNAVIKRSAKY